MRMISLLAVVALVVSACDALQPAKDNSAANLMPNISGYTTVNTLDIQDTLSKVAGAATLLTNPPFAAMVTAANEVSKCYQQAGAVEGRVYYGQADPSKVGAIVIINRNKVLDPALLLNCVGGQAGLSGSLSVQPCSKTYTLKKDNNEFYIGYVATDPQVCQTFCSSLEGCVQ
jgi:hypothetical protein